MLKTSIYAVFEKMWQNVLIKFNDYVQTEDFNDHIENTDNPHGVTAEQLGLDRVDNTSDLEKPISYATQVALDEKADARVVDDRLSALENTVQNINSVPSCNSSNNEQFLCVVNGVATWKTIETWSGGDY